MLPAVFRLCKVVVKTTTDYVGGAEKALVIRMLKRSFDWYVGSKTQFKRSTIQKRDFASIRPYIHPQVHSVINSVFKIIIK